MASPWGLLAYTLLAWSWDGTSHRGKIEAVSKDLQTAEETIDGVDERQRVVKDQINTYVDEVSYPHLPRQA